MTPDRSDTLIDDATRAAESPRAVADGARGGPIFIAGPDRSGTTLLYALLASHPNISMVRRTNMWRYFDRRYGDLRDPANLDRCLHDMVTYRRMRHLHPDAERIRREFLAGPATYGRLFALFYEHHAERTGRARWGDKSLHTEHYASRVFAEYPDARIIHIVRDPRDRYASVRKRWGRDAARVGAATGRWLLSTRAGLRNARRYPSRYVIVRYEDLAREPEATMRRVCAFVGERFDPAMLSMTGAPEHRDTGGNSSFGDIEPGAISTRAIGRFREVLTPSEIAFIDLVARRSMRSVGYAPDAEADRPGAGRWIRDVPVQFARMIAWMALAEVSRRRGVRVPRGKMTDDPEADADA
jgi:hypothetical protein